MTFTYITVLFPVLHVSGHFVSTHIEMKEEDKQKEQTEKHKSVKKAIYVHFCKYNSKLNCSFDSILTHLTVFILMCRKIWWLFHQNRFI